MIYYGINIFSLSQIRAVLDGNFFPVVGSLFWSSCFVTGDDWTYTKYKNIGETKFQKWFFRLILRQTAFFETPHMYASSVEKNLLFNVGVENWSRFSNFEQATRKKISSSDFLRFAFFWFLVCIYLRFRIRCLRWNDLKNNSNANQNKIKSIKISEFRWNL